MQSWSMRSWYSNSWVKEVIRVNDVSNNFSWNPYDATVGKELIDCEGTHEAIKYFSTVCDRLTNYAYWFFLSTLWVSYTGFSDIDLWKRLFSSDRGQKKKSIMKPSEVIAFEQLPYFVKVYRAHRPNESDWISYTFSKDIAFKFAGERRVSTVSEYEIKRRDITALFLRRGEYEIILLDKEKARFIREHIVLGNGMGMSPWQPGDKGYVCLPLRRNVPNPKHHDWKLVTCNLCGAECWETDTAREVMKNHGMKAACTKCSLKAGRNQGMKITNN